MTEIASLLISMVLVSLTAILAVYTRTLAQEARATRLQQIQPQVVVTIEPGKHFSFMNLVITNVGRGVARNIRIEADPDFELEKNKGGHMFNEYSFLELDSLKPGQEIKHYIGSYRHLSQKQTKITSTYFDVSERQHSFTSTIDVSALGGLSRLGEDPFERIAKNIEKLAQLLQITIRSNRLRVDCFSADDRRKELEEHEKWIEQISTENAKATSEDNDEDQLASK